MINKAITEPAVRTSEHLLNSAYNAIDIYLKDLISGKAESNFDISVPFHSTEATIAFDIMLKYSLIYLRTGNRNSSIVDITSRGISVDIMGGIRSFFESLSDENYAIVKTRELQQEVLKMQLENQQKDDAFKELQALNLTLQNEQLKYQNSIKLLDKDLRDAQYQLSILQAKEIKTKRIWAFLGAIGGAILAYVGKKILGQ
jgi:hypothetical protein